MKIDESECAKKQDTAGIGTLTYCCPDCKTPLCQMNCSSCGVTFEVRDGFPFLLSRDPRFQSGAKIGTVYDDIYVHRAGVWEDQGRTPEFIRFFSDLLSRRTKGRVLEVGCGEGFLLSAVRAEEKFAIDLSTEALRKASGRTQAEFCVALAERLPLPADSFDLVTSVGVMEHFVDDVEASKEIRRVLKCGGTYIALIHVHLSPWQRVVQKFREYIFPRPRPVAMLQWLSTKFIRPITQPIQRGYTRDSAQACLEKAGFALEGIVSTTTQRNVPLIGPHVLILVATKN